MHKKHKILSVLLAGILPAAALLGCSGATTSTSSAAATVSETSTASAAEISETTNAAPVTEAAPFDYSKGLEENGFWQGVNASDFVTLPDYKNISVPAATHTVTDEQIQAEIDSLLYQYTSTTEVKDRAIADGDRVNLDYVGSVDGVPFEGGSTEGMGTEVTIGVTQYIDDFLEQLIGHTPGEAFEIQVTFPEDYGQENLNGKEATFAITLNYIIENVVPELTDAFVEENFFEAEGFKTVAELKEDIQKNIQSNAITAFVQQFVVENSTVSELPESMLVYQEESMLAFYEGIAASNGATLEQIIQMYEGVATKEELVAKNLEYNTTAATFNLTVQAIAEQENFSVSDADLAEYFKTETGSEDYSSYEEEYGKPYLMQVVIIQKVMDLLQEYAILA